MALSSLDVSSSSSIRALVIVGLSALLITSIWVTMPTQKAYAHFNHFTHYNNRGDTVGPYYAYEALDPEYAAPNRPTALLFSVQDNDGHDTYNIVTMVEIYSIATGERLKAFPWTKEDVGDFQLYYNFPSVGNYAIVLSVATGGGPVNLNSIDPPRDTLISTAGCNCDRAVFNVSVSTLFGAIWTDAMYGAVIGPITLFGIVLGIVYWGRRKDGHKPETFETVKWIIMLLAIAGGLVHLSVFADHASLRIEYSIFLIVAGIMQIRYGVSYILLTLKSSPARFRDPVYSRSYYKKTLGLNLFGLLGTAVLIGLYTYAVIFPPPLSPNNQPEDIDAAGILAKSTEVTLVFGILYLMRTEKKRFEKRIAIARTYHDDDDSTGIDEGYFASTNTNTKESI
jgi:hypothetical protein